MRILLCLLSEQHVPNLLSVHHFKPDWLILIESKQMEGKSHSFLNALKAGDVETDRFNYSNRFTRVSLDRVDDMLHVREVIDATIKDFPESDWLVNLTGGNKLMALATYDCFTKHTSRLFYIEHGQPRNMIFLESTSTETSEHKLSIREFLAGYGYELNKTSQQIATLAEQDTNLWEVSRILAENATQDDLFDFTNNERNTAREKGITIASHKVEKLDKASQEAITSGFGVQEDGSLILNKIGGKFVTGDWLEVFVWGILTRNAKALDINDVQRSIKPSRTGDKEPNEMDVVFVDSEMALIMVECKSGKQGQNNAMDIFYKVNSVAGQSRALKAKAVLVTTSDFLLDPQRPGEFKTRAKELSGLFRLPIVLREQIQELARQPDNVELIRQTFLSKR